MPTEPTAPHAIWRLEVYAAVAVQLLVLIAVEQVAGLTWAGWLTATGYLLALCVAVAAGHAGTVGSIGPANLITLARALVVGGVLALVVTAIFGESPSWQRWLIAGLAVLVVILDGVDGQVARRTGSSSQFGARFDVEIDSVLALGLAALLAVELTPLALIIGLARYLYLAAAGRWSWLRLPLPVRRSRKVIGLIGLGSLTVASVPSVPEAIGVFILGVGAGCVAYSFARDVIAQRCLG